MTGTITPADEQEQLRQTVRRFLDEKSPSSEVRRLMETQEGYDETVWKQMAQELALQGIHIPEQYGGQGFSFVELGIVLAEMGGSLLCSPFFSTVCLAANAIMAAGTEEQKADLLSRIASGDAIATLALAEPSGRWDAEGVSVQAAAADGAYRISGTKTYVTDGHIADVIVVVARTFGTAGAEGIGLFVVDGDAEGLTRRSLEVVDPTRKQAELTFSDVAAAPLGEPGSAWSAVEKTLEHAAACLSAEMVGGAQRCLDMAVEYAKTRVQFGRPIGMFQAVKHKCADMLVAAESGRAACDYALMAAAEEDDELPVVASLAKAFCSDAYFQVASDNIQVHGGLGFTWEHDAHLYFRRAKSSELLLGDATYHRELVARHLGI